MDAKGNKSRGRELAHARKLARELRERRQAEGLTQAEVAESFGLSQQTVARMETGGVAGVLMVFLSLLLFYMTTRNASIKTAAKKVKRLYPLTGKRLQRKREEELKLTQKELAEELGIARATVNRWERGYFDDEIGSYHWLNFTLDMLKARRARPKDEKKDAADKAA